MSSIVIALDEQEVQKNINIAIFAIVQATWFWTNILIICAEIRIALGMFLQLNPYYEPFATLWTYTDPVFNFGRAYYPKMLGFDICPWANMYFINNLLIGLDVWLHGVNEMNSGPEHPTMEVESTDERYVLIDKYLRAVRPKTKQEWLESFSFEDIYFHRVPGAPPWGQGGPEIKIPTSLPIIDRLPISTIEYHEPNELEGYGISLGNDLLNSIYHLILEIICIPLHLLQFLTSH